MSSNTLTTDKDCSPEHPTEDTQSMISSEYISSLNLYHRTRVEPISWNFYPKSLYKILMSRRSLTPNVITEDEENYRTFNSWVSN